MTDQQSRPTRGLDTAVATVGQRDLGCVAGEDLDQLELAVHRVAVIRVAGHGAHAHHQALFGRHCDGHFHAELVGRSGFALGDALCLGRVQRIQLVLVAALLRVQSSGDVEFGLQPSSDLTGLALHVADDPAQPSPQLPDLALHAPVLLGMGVAAGLVLGSLADPGVALAQVDPGSPRFQCNK
uniref:NagN n=1 Tax=Ralstonia sp. U2 TaxID=70356 RepID=Q9EXL6_9RALS|nr:NagN [Ralstonia sp. U2]